MNFQETKLPQNRPLDWAIIVKAAMRKRPQQDFNCFLSKRGPANFDAVRGDRLDLLSQPKLPTPSGQRHVLKMPLKQHPVHRSNDSGHCGDFENLA